MTLDQGISFAIVLCTIGMLVWGRIAYDLVALMALLAGILTGVVPVKEAFEGFSNEVVIIVAAALVISAAVARSGAIEALMHPLLPRLKRESVQVPVLSGAVGLLSIFCKNVGALAIFMPVASQLSRRTGSRLSALLMPMAFASLLGGLCTLIGTSPNIIVAQVRADMFGKPFGMFAYTPVGLSVAVLGLAFLAVAYKLVPGHRKAAAGMDAAFNLENYITEAMLPDGSPFAGQTIAELERAGDGAVTVATVIRERFRRYVPQPGWVLNAGDVLLLQGEPEDLERLVARARLRLAGERHGEVARASEDTSVVEGVVTAESSLLGQTVRDSGLRDQHGVTLVALSRNNAESSWRRLGATRFRAGDVVVLKGPADTMPDTLGDLHVLPLAERHVALGRSHRGWLPALVLVVAMATVAVHLLPVQVAFFAAAVVLLLMRVLTMHEAYETVEWSLLILLGALIPVSHAVSRTGGADLIASYMQPVLGGIPPWAALALVQAITMIITPFLHNAPTVLVFGPIAAKLAMKLGLNPDAFLMAVALGAGCDFLTPIGHQCNTLVYGPGGYKFSDYSRLGAPLSLLVLCSGVPLIMLFWGLRA